LNRRSRYPLTSLDVAKIGYMGISIRPHIGTSAPTPNGHAVSRRSIPDTGKHFQCSATFVSTRKQLESQIVATPGTTSACYPFPLASASGAWPQCHQKKTLETKTLLMGMTSGPPPH
jgi:hypothetical protein